jgi:hypothetical protein
VAAIQDKVEILDKLWVWAKELLNIDELNNDLLLTKDSVEKMSCITQHIVTMYRY